jgi:rhodanese-related sulfurtransferase
VILMPAKAKTAAHLVAEAKARVASLSPREAADALRHGDALLVDLRETEERLEHGSIRGAVHAPRGMLEFYADPTSAYFHPEFDPNRRTILCCTSGARAALAAEALQSLGYADVAYLAGGLRAWREAGLAIEPGS